MLTVDLQLFTLTQPHTVSGVDILWKTHLKRYRKQKNPTKLHHSWKTPTTARRCLCLCWTSYSNI